MIDDSVAERPRRVVVGVDGSLGSMQALRRAVAEASVLAWTPPGGEGAYRSPPCPLLLDEWRAEHARRLKTTWNEALGGVPEDLTVHLLVIRGDAGRVLVELADRVDDLLVVGAGRRRPCDGSCVLPRSVTVSPAPAAAR
jgi:nucleotide-binding universal stress UspA family protein